MKLIRKSPRYLFPLISLFCFCGSKLGFAQKAAKIPSEIIEKQLSEQPNDHAGRVIAGFHYFDTGKYEKALGHFTRAVELQPKDAYDRAWLYMAQIRIDSKASGDTLRNFLKHNKSGEYIDTAIKVLLGDVTPEYAVDLATKSKDLGNVCEAHYFSAQRLLANGSTKNAVKHLKAALKTDKKTFWEYQSAIAHLKWAEQDIASQSATRSESKSEGGDKSQPESEVRSQ